MLMKKSDHFTWTPEAQEALDSLKNILKSPLMLTAPTTEEPVLLYISTTTQVVSAALVVKWEELEGPKRYNGKCTSSARYSPTLRRATHRCKNLCTRS
jgi:hypothetical protein